MLIKLTQMRPGQAGLVADIRGGRGINTRLENMGIRRGRRILKVSSYFGLGPQMVEVDKMRVAIGFGMAERIFVEVSG
ncbi:MAG: ferrous iron transport protein A [Endomicrobiales bacterium]|nr:ferrous iron transport protein A [Endomicrobiales bacterium]